MEFLGLLMNKDYLSNLTFGATFLNLTIVGICSLNISGTFLTVVRLGAIICNFLMGIILILNNSSKAKYSPLYKPYWLGMIFCNILIVKMIKISYPVAHIALLYVIGFIIVMLSLFSLGHSFAVTPMLSKIKTHYIYRFVRHPMYLGESIMLFSCVVASETIISMLVFFLYLTNMVLRIQEEEKLLLQTDEYKGYCTKTRWKLFPYVW